MTVNADRTCTVADCVGSGKLKRGLCNRHYLKWLKYGDPVAGATVERAPGRLCAMPECGKPYLARGYCRYHYDITCAERRSAQSKAWKHANADRVRARNLIRYNSDPAYRELVKDRARRRRQVAPTGRKARRLRIAARDSWLCALCGRPVDPELRWPDPLSASLDHVVPVSRGGSDEDDNVQLAHQRCNNRKYNKLLEAFRQSQA